MIVRNATGRVALKDHTARLLEAFVLSSYFAVATLPSVPFTFTFSVVPSALATFTV